MVSAAILTADVATTRPAGAVTVTAGASRYDVPAFEIDDATTLSAPPTISAESIP